MYGHRRPVCACGGLLAAGVLGLAGCGGEPTYAMTPVEGVVKLDGKPAANVSVQFMPDVMRGGKGPTSAGESGPDGRFTLKTYDGKDGAVVGPHLMVLFDLDEERPEQGQPRRKPIRLDARYAMSANGLPVEVKPGQPITLEAGATFRK